MAAPRERLPLSPSKVQKAREAIDFLSSLSDPDPGSTEPRPSGPGPSEPGPSGYSVIKKKGHPGAKVRVNARVTARNMRYFARISRTFTRDHAF